MHYTDKAVFLCKEALCPRISIMAHGRLRCLGSAQHLKAKFGKGFQIELKVANAGPRDEDCIEIARALSKSVKPQNVAMNTNEDEEQGANAVAQQNVFFTLEQAKAALQALTGDDFLSPMIGPDSPTGYMIWKEATTTVTGCPLEALAAFASAELRLRAVETFMKDIYPDNVLRERQDNKVRYEVPSDGVRISGIFETIETNKVRLRLSDYGVSQTSLEQVFNIHAAEAERMKEGRNDG
jgi:ATP-binding cassette, subfamily A (ABC1), member 3